MTITSPTPNPPSSDLPPKVLPLEVTRPPTFSDRLTSLLNRRPLPPESLVLLAAFFIGGGTGLAIAAFRYLTWAIQDFSFEFLMGLLFPLGGWTLALIPTLGGLLVGVLRWRSPFLFGQGWSALLSDSRDQTISPLRPLMKLVSAALSLGTGASLGTEGPSVEIGANIGVLLGQGFQVAKERYRLLLGAGAAAGLAAGFNAPIAGVFFAMEVVLGPTSTTQGASLILLSAVVSGLIARAVFGVQAEFDLPTYQMASNWEWVCYLGLGVMASAVSLAYTQAIRFCQRSFQGDIPALARLGQIPTLWKPVIGGAGVGLLALGVPQILGVGYSTLDVILKGEVFPLGMLVLLLGTKLIATALSLGSGLVGGIFAPSMFLGACLGGIYGTVLNTVLPPGIADGIAPPAAYAMVGMAAVLGSSARAPLTAILLLFELTRNYLIILPLMAAVGVSVWIVERMQAMPAVQALALPQMGVNLRKADDHDLLQQVQVAAVMNPTYLALPATLTIAEAGQNMVKSKQFTALVVDEAQQLIGVFSLADVNRHLKAAENGALENRASEDRDKLNPDKFRSNKLNPEQLTLRDICTTEVLCAYPDEAIAQAMDRMSARGLHLLPVVATDNLRQVLGVIEQHQIAHAAAWVNTQSLLAHHSSLEKLPTPSRSNP
ncbi:MAG: chloride channel protein [Thermosynechococcaceae cyanobacterium MS004]|nr:chloride channel protein [Thermosynechococcaceae cyanobacterium MS004]